MQHKTRPILVNLLLQDPFYETLPGRILSWASTIGRYLVIFTEIVVIISFATRFKLDRDLTDLNTLLVQKSALIESYGNLEQDVRIIQRKTSLVASQQQEYSPPEILSVIETIIPKQVTLTLLQITSQQITFTGRALTSTDLAMMIVALQQRPEFSQVTISQVSSTEQGDPGFVFTLQASLIEQASSQQNTAPASNETVQEPVL